MKRTDPANFNKQISIVTHGESIGAGGIISETPVSVWSGWAAIWPVSSKESRENMRVGMNITHNIRMYYREGIEPTMKVLFKDRSFEIKGIVNPEEANIYLDLVCEEKL